MRNGFDRLSPDRSAAGRLISCQAIATEYRVPRNAGETFPLFRQETTMPDRRVSYAGAVLAVAWLIAAIVAPRPTRAELPPLIPRKVLFGNPDKAAPRISPDGKRLAYVAPDPNGVMNVWVRTIGKADDQVVTADKKRGVRTFFWQGDSRHVLYMQDQ